MVVCGAVWHVVWYGGMVVWHVVWYGVVWCGLVGFSVVCVVWCGMENRGLPKSALHESSENSVRGDRHGIAVRL